MVTIVLASSLILLGTAKPTITPAVERIRRAQAITTPKPVAPIAVAKQPSEDCPQMDNPGGRMHWSPSKDPGPTATDATVALPTLGVEAPIVRVGIDAQNLMVVPKNAREVAWLDQGGIPGRTNNVVLAGHINYSRVAGSFSRIGQLQVGHEIVFKVDGKDLRYIVQWNCLFDRNTDRAEQIMGYTNEESLTLISCGGVFDSAVGTHNKRIAVRAIRIHEVRRGPDPATGVVEVVPTPTPTPGDRGGLLPI